MPRTPHCHVPHPLPGQNPLGHHLEKTSNSEENLFEASGHWARWFLWFIWLHICSLNRIPVFPGCHQCPTRVPNPTLLCCAWRFLQSYKAILGLESLDLQKEIPCKPHALKCSIWGGCVHNLIKKSSWWFSSCPVWDVHPGFSVWARFCQSEEDKEGRGIWVSARGWCPDWNFQCVCLALHIDPALTDFNGFDAPNLAGIKPELTCDHTQLFLRGEKDRKWDAV